MNLTMTMLALAIVVPGLAAWGHGDKPAVHRAGGSHQRWGGLMAHWHFSSLRYGATEHIAHFVYFCNIDRISYEH